MSDQSGDDENVLRSEEQVFQCSSGTKNTTEPNQKIGFLLLNRNNKLIE